MRRLCKMDRTSLRGLGSGRGERGFTFVEVLIAITLMVIGFLGVYASLYASALLRETSNETNIAVFKLQSAMEYIFNVPFDDVTARLPAGTPIDISTLMDSNASNDYRLKSEQIVTAYTFPTTDMMHFTATITWQSRLGTNRSETIACARAR